MEIFLLESMQVKVFVYKTNVLSIDSMKFIWSEVDSKLHTAQLLFTNIVLL